MQSFFGKGQLSSDRESKEYLTVNNCGCYKNINVDLRTVRMQGRKDFQYIYIDKGEGDFEIGGKEVTISEGSVVLFKPHEKQVYSFSAESDADYYWIHFSGIGANEIIEKLGFSANIYSVGRMLGVRNKIEKMIEICRLGGRNLEIYSAGLLAEVLSETEENINSENMTMKKVIEKMHDCGNAKIKNKEYAKMCGISEYHFIRKFKAETGKTPLKYRTEIVIERACDLLLRTTLNVSETAACLGFDDTFYFSRIFKKETGMTPSEFRMKNKL